MCETDDTRQKVKEPENRGQTNYQNIHEHPNGSHYGQKQHQYEEKIVQLEQQLQDERKRVQQLEQKVELLSLNQQVQPTFSRKTQQNLSEPIKQTQIQQWTGTSSGLQYNILLFGETGAGKSTLINYFTNYFNNGSLEGLKIAIPTKYHQATEGFKSYEKNLQDSSKSKTSQCTDYTFRTNGITYNFIDTPGLSDTEGTAKDDEHIIKIMTAAEKRGTLSAIVIVINGTVSRSTVNVRNTLTLLKGSVPDDLQENLLIILTNCLKGESSFDLKLLSSLNISKENVFYMNNAALNTPVEKWEDEEIMDNLRYLWGKSMNTIGKIIQKVEKLGNKATTAFRDMRLKREKIKAELHGILLEVKKLQTMQDELNCAQNAQEGVTNDIQKYSNYKQTRQVNYIEMEECDYNNTICSKHTRVCHENCQLPYTEEEGNEVFKGCACMNGSPNCTQCECDHTTHYHATKKPLQKSKTVEDILHDVKALYDQNTDKKAQLQSKISSLSSDIKSLRGALDAKEAGIKKCCEDLKTLCSHFNFVDELKSIIDIMITDARTLTNMQARQDAQSRINSIVELANQLSKTK